MSLQESLPTASVAAMKRIISDIKQITRNPLTDHGIYYVHDETNMMKASALMIGPENTPYHGGFYFFDITYPYNYPHSPPMIKYCTNYNNIRFHPNMYVSGKVCVSILNTWRGDQWTSCQTITSVLLTICSLFDNEPLTNEPGFENVNERRHNHISYKELITYCNLDIAVLGIVNTPEKILPDKFSVFKDTVIQQFLKKYDVLHEKICGLLEEFPVSYRLYCNPYRINIQVDYPSLKTQFEETYHRLVNCKIESESHEKENKI